MNVYYNSTTYSWTPSATQTTTPSINLRTGGVTKFVPLLLLAGQTGVRVRVRHNANTYVAKTYLDDIDIPAGVYTEVDFINRVATFVGSGATRELNAEVNFQVRAVGGGAVVRHFRKIGRIRRDVSSGSGVAGRTTSSTWLRFANKTGGNYEYSNDGSTWLAQTALSGDWSYCLSGIPPSSTGYEINLLTGINFI